MYLSANWCKISSYHAITSNLVLTSTVGKLEGIIEAGVAAQKSNPERAESGIILDVWAAGVVEVEDFRRVEWDASKWLIEEWPDTGNEDISLEI